MRSFISKNPLVSFFIGCILIVVLFLITPFLVHRAVDWYNHHYNLQNEKAIGVGEFSDQFGTVNTLFSTFAFLILFITLQLQIRENKKINDDNNLRNFEGQFYFLLNTLLSQIDKVSGEFTTIQNSAASTHSGYSYFNSLYKNASEISIYIQGNEYKNDLNTIPAGTLLKRYNMHHSDVYNKFRANKEDNFFSKILIEQINNKRYMEFHFVLGTYNSLIWLLIQEYKRRRNTGVSAYEASKSMASYIAATSSIVPIPARVMFLYLNIYHNKSRLPGHNVELALYGDIHSNNFFHVTHKDIIIHDATEIIV